MALQLVDTHCHIQSAGADIGEKHTLEKWAKVPDRTPDVMVAAAVDKNVTKMVCVGCDVEDSRLAVEFVQNRPECFASIGIHPHEAQIFAGKTKELETFAHLITREKVLAVGECGLDYYYQHSPKKEQTEILRFQIELAIKYEKPLIFHIRDAFDDFWPIFDFYASQSPIRGVLHSFTDNQANLDKALIRGLYVGVNGIATFSKDAQQLKMYNSIPLSRLLLETDAPFLTPSPYRGTICEPYHISVIAEFLGGLRNESLDELANATTKNARQLFKM